MSKRIFDLLLVVPAIVLLAPLMGVIALQVKLGSDGPILFRQTRVGQYGNPFKILKFRTMIVRSEVTGVHITTNGDLRITVGGVFLRRNKLDELPQLFNVLKGDMSLVGPRPEVPEYVALYPENMRDEVLSVRPGVTGPASLVFHDEGAILAETQDPHRRYTQEVLPRKLGYDLEYVRNQNLGKNIGILWKTILMLVGRLPDSHYDADQRKDVR
jgi:lipopolysaccharide/colanic/teichoic acid biosynthesis glycosyltransferase